MFETARISAATGRGYDRRMSKFRFLIEQSAESQRWKGVFTISQITPDDDTGMTIGYADTVDAAKQSVATDFPGLRWKTAPEAWQPDAVAVSDYLDDGVEEHRDQ